MYWFLRCLLNPGISISHESRRTGYKTKKIKFLKNKIQNILLAISSTADLFSGPDEMAVHLK